MNLRPLGRTDIRVSPISLGTMTFGHQNSEAEGHAQLDLAFAHGVNFMDSAEMYSFPAAPETQGRSEEILGSWMKARGNRDRVIVSTKITGPGDRFRHIRGASLRYTRENIADAVDLSLKRLGTDYIDLYQTHWPERAANYFGKFDYAHVDGNAEGDDWTPLAEVLAGLKAQIDAGKIRAVGVSNETPWGLGRMLALAKVEGLPRVASVQNPYSLINRTFDVGLAEIAMREDCGLYAYSPLGFGALTGKYLDGPAPEGSRIALFPNFQRNFKPNGVRATRAYVELAREHGLSPAAMAIAFVMGRPWTTSVIIGATTNTQLEENLDAADLVLGDDLLAAIDAVHADNPNPAP